MKQYWLEILLVVIVITLVGLICNKPSPPAIAQQDQQINVAKKEIVEIKKEVQNTKIEYAKTAIKYNQSKQTISNLSEPEQMHLSNENADRYKYLSEGDTSKAKIFNLVVNELQKDSTLLGIADSTIILQGLEITKHDQVDSLQQVVIKELKTVNNRLAVRNTLVGVAVGAGLTLFLIAIFK